MYIVFLLSVGFSKERWEAGHGTGCATSQEMLWKLDALQTFIRELQWPDEVFAEHLEDRLKHMASDMIEAASNRCLKWGSLLSLLLTKTKLPLPFCL